MKIAQIAPLYEAVPPRLYGGTERVVAHLTDALVDLGHEVTLFASGDSETRARLIPVRDQSIRLDPAPLKSDLAAHITLLSRVLEMADQFDILHFHTDMIHFPFMACMADRTVTTLHGRLDLKDLEAVYDQWEHFRLVSISNDQRRPLPRANWHATVQHGLPENLYPFNETPKGYLAFLGRISPEKRPDRAIEIATTLGKTIKIAAKVDPADQVYWETVIQPMVEGNPLIDFVGEIDDAQKSTFLGGADALLFLIDWPEPFGLVMIEAMACGTPVIAFKTGSTSEVIDHGATGFLVETMEDAINCTRHVHKLDRHSIRARFEKQFSATAMARRYLDVYGQILAQLPYGTAMADPVLTPSNLRPEPRAFLHL